MTTTAPRLFVSVFAYALGKDPDAPAIVQAEIEAGERAEWPAFRTLDRVRRVAGPVILSVSHGSLIAKARSLALGEFLASGAPAWLSIDDDIEATASDVVRMLEAVGDVDVLIGPCALRVGKSKPPKLNVVTELPAAETPTRRLASGPLVFPIQSGGVAFSLVTRAAAVKLWDDFEGLRFIDPLFERPGLGVFLELVRGGAWWGEDYAFCQRVRESGLRLEAMCDTAIVHAGVCVSVPPGALRSDTLAG